LPNAHSIKVNKPTSGAHLVPSGTTTKPAPGTASIVASSVAASTVTKTPNSPAVQAPPPAQGAAALNQRSPSPVPIRESLKTSLARSGSGEQLLAAQQTAAPTAAAASSATAPLKPTATLAQRLASYNTGSQAPPGSTVAAAPTSGPGHSGGNNGSNNNSTALKATTAAMSPTKSIVTTPVSPLPTAAPKPTASTAIVATTPGAARVGRVFSRGCCPETWGVLRSLLLSPWWILRGAWLAVAIAGNALGRYVCACKPCQ
jgi:hypothetical protein